jgi:hypothetical protein
MSATGSRWNWRNSIIGGCEFRRSPGWRWPAHPFLPAVDATDAPRRLFHVQMTIPARPGPMTLLYPEWIPGEHAQRADRQPGRAEDGGRREAGRVEARQREHVCVSHRCSGGRIVGRSGLRFHLAAGGGGYSSGIGHQRAGGAQLEPACCCIPRARRPTACNTRPRCGAQLWRYGTALPIARESGSEIEFQPAPLTTLIDSPVLAGRTFAPSSWARIAAPRTTFTWPADSDRALEMSPEVAPSTRTW